MPGAPPALTTSATETTSSPDSGCVPVPSRVGDEARPRLGDGAAGSASLPPAGLLPLPLGSAFPQGPEGPRSTGDPRTRQVTVVLETRVDEPPASHTARARRADFHRDSRGPCRAAPPPRPPPAPGARAPSRCRVPRPEAFCSLAFHPILGPGGLKRNGN